MRIRTKTKKEQKTPKQKLSHFLRILLIIIIVAAILGIVAMLVNTIGLKSNKNFISSIAPVEYEEQLTPKIDDNGYYTFVTDEDFKILQLTDIHIGGGFLSTQKDNMALNAVAAMVSQEKPDLVVVTGDIAFPVPFQAGTLNNKNSAELFAELMEQLGVYWCLSFGNHDTEAYSYYSREEMSDFYSSGDYPHCLFQKGPDIADGFGNYFVNVKNTFGEITQCIVMLDSHSYVDGDWLGIAWKYDTIHKNQVDWYERELKNIQKENYDIMPKSLVFFHIPVPEYKTAWYEFRDNEFKNTMNVQYIYGKAGETSEVIYTSEHNYGFFDKARELGSTQGIFCGHDHLNNFSLNYKDMRLTYGYSIDYLAYSGIKKYGLQRGCTIINVSTDGAFDCHLENYYQDKYQSVNAKESVLMTDYNDGSTNGQPQD